MAVRSTARRAAPVARGAVRATRGVARVSRKAGMAQGRLQARLRSSGETGRASLVGALAAGAGAGIAIAYLFDPQEGRRRRHVLRDRVLAALRRREREAERQARYMASKAQGAVAAATTPERDPSELNDPALEAKVESELFRSPDVGREHVNVNVEDGRVQLRGEVPSREQMEDLVRRTCDIAGITEVESFLHLPGEPAPTQPATAVQGTAVR